MESRTSFPSTVCDPLACSLLPLSFNYQILNEKFPGKFFKIFPENLSIFSLTKQNCIDILTTGRFSQEGNRRRPLHTCGLSFLIMVHKSYTKAQEINGPIGSLTKKLAQLFTWAGPIIYAMQYQWLAILSFADDGILSLERAIETVFPPSILVFNKIDQLVQTAENLPRKFDDAVDNFPATIRKVPAIDWIWSLFRNLTRCDSEHTKEKEISVDENCNSESASVEAKADSPKQKEIEKKAICAAAKLNVKRGSYKEALENKTKKNRGGKEEIQEDKMTKGENRENNEMMMKSLNEDPIMELFETAWLMKPVRREN